MKIYLLVALAALLLVYDSGKLGAANLDPIENAVLLSAYVTKVPRPQITIRWEDADAALSTYSIKRKVVDDNDWKQLTKQDITVNSYCDTDVIVGKAYEYQVTKSGPDYRGYGFICSGIELEAVESRGKVMLIVDKTVAKPLEAELKRFETDLVGDGWKVVRLDVPRGEQFNPALVQNIKKRISEEYLKESGALKSVILFGRVAVPYSGATAVDGHSEHLGAWPADVYYADISGIWTDTSAITATAQRPENHNVPLDGKFDQSTVPGSADIELGRIDLFNLPSFNDSEVELLRKYLDKDHKFRMAITQLRYRGLIDDKFKMYSGDSFASDAWMNFSPLLGPSKLDSGVTLEKELSRDSYLWSYGCNPGSYTSVQDVIYANAIANKPLNGIFILLLGSWLPDWDYPDNILRASIASSPSMLASCFAGRPYWHFHHMAMGWDIGYATKLTQNNSFTYQTGQKTGLRGIHISLMGDPTLRMHVVSPPSDLSLDYYNLADETTVNIKISWKSSSDDIIGYYIYRASDINGDFRRLNGEAVTETTFTDLKAPRGKNVYMVRALKLETTPSGTYYNLSQGIFLETDTELSVADNTDGDNTTVVHASPNPASERASFYFSNPAPGFANIAVYDLNGIKVKDIYSAWINTGAQKFDWDLRDNSGLTVSPGFYMLKVTYSCKTLVGKFMVSP
jgi:fibronectin type 3 domain-containing protein